MKDRYHLSRKESIFLAKQRWDESIYSGMRMENRNVTFPETQTILNGINVAGVELSDIQAILNMRDAWEYLLIHIDDTLSVSYLCKLQERVAHREALAEGELRTGSIGISGVNYQPPVPDILKAQVELSKLLEEPLCQTEIALNVFTWITRSQLFWDGNKRTALLASNKILVENGLGTILVPEEIMVEFSTTLNAYYETGDSKPLKSLLYNSCIFGIDSGPSSFAEAFESQRHSNTANIRTRNRRTPNWLKQARKNAGMTQRELAQAINISTSAIANIEQGQRKGSDEVWAKIERCLRI